MTLISGKIKPVAIAIKASVSQIACQSVENSGQKKFFFFNKAL